MNVTAVNKHMLQNTPRLIGLAPASVGKVNRFVSASAGTVTANATGTRKVRLRRSALG